MTDLLIGFLALVGAMSIGAAVFVAWLVTNERNNRK